MNSSEHSIKVPRIYKAARNIAKTVKEEGGSLKRLIYDTNHTNIKGLYALVAKTLQKEDVLDVLIKKSKILKKEEKADPWLIRILITELLFGKKKLPGNSKPVQIVLSYLDVLLAVLEKTEKKGIFNLDPKPEQGAKPRFVRVNTLMISVDDAITYFQNEGWTLIKRKRKYNKFLKKISSLAETEFTQDIHIEELLVFPIKTEFFHHRLYLNGSIVLQDKASCLASWLLNPTPGSITLDMCAAPGMKTTHLAAIMQNQGKLHAVEMNSERFKDLCNQIDKCGVKCVETHNEDALKVGAESCKGVEFILVDPSCSGSGMVGRLEISNEGKSTERLRKLAGFQSKLLRHALSNFPDAKRVVYSTCSLNVEENEQVVASALEAEKPYFEVADNLLEGKWLHHGSQDYEWGSRCLYARPDVDLTNGFFIAVLDRIRAATPQEAKDNSLDKPNKKRHKRKKKNESDIIHESK